MNSFNYVREQHLQLLSIETLGIVVVVAFYWYLARRKQASLEVAYFLALPFTDVQFRIASVQPVEVLSILVIAANYKKIRLNYVLLLASIFIVFSLMGYTSGESSGFFSLLYSLRFLLTAFVFSILSRTKFSLPLVVLRFMVVFCFSITFLQIFLWLLGLPIHGIFFDWFPRAKGLAQEPAPWAIFIITLFPFILHFKLGRIYLLLNAATLIMTLSTFGIIATGTFLLLRWGLSGFRVRVKKIQVQVAATAVCMLVGLAILNPALTERTAVVLGAFDKLVWYSYELSSFTGLDLIARPTGLSVSQSGRGSDLKLLEDPFPRNWLVGIGSFNSRSEQGVIATNTYIMFLVELGVVGTALVGVVLFLYYRGMLKQRRSKSVDFLAYSLNLFIMIAGIRCFAFHELWYTHACVLRTCDAEEMPHAVETAA